MGLELVFLTIQFQSPQKQTNDFTIASVKFIFLPGRAQLKLKGLDKVHKSERFLYQYRQYLM